jgi:hypothetical protein
MSLITSLKTARGLRRLTPILAIGVLALLSGCVVYPAGGYYDGGGGGYYGGGGGYYGPPHGGNYYHNGYYR